MKKLLTFVFAFSLTMVLVTSCKTKDEPTDRYSAFTRDFIARVDRDPQFKSLLEKSIALCKQINPDTITNPVQSLSQYYDFVEWSTKCMPWNILVQDEQERDLFTRIDQSLNYFYWLVDQPLDELRDRDYYRPTLQYHEPFRSWLIDYTKHWGQFLSTSESWTDEYLHTAQANPMFGLSKGWYEDPSNWHSYNDFFARRLVSPDQRPIASPDDASLMVSPVDGEPQGIWSIDKEGLLNQKEGVQIKSRKYRSVEELLASSQYREQFREGTMVHTFLNVHDYHRYHFPLGGKVVELLNIPGDEAIGGDVTFDPAIKQYVIDCHVPQWQSIETRALLMLQTEEYGLIALMPIGMSQICSCNWEENIKVGMTAVKGEPLGYYLFGGSDFVILFQKGVTVTIDPVLSQGASYKHVLQGEPFCHLKK